MYEPAWLILECRRQLTAGRFEMKKYAIRAVVALLTFLIGVSLYLALFSRRQRSVITPTLVSANSKNCYGLVAGESQPEAPVRLSISNAACTHLSKSVRFTLENISDKPIVKYEVRGLRTHGRTISSYLNLTSEFTNEMDPHELRTEVIEERSDSQLTSFQLAVWSVTFADGTTWNR